MNPAVMSSLPGVLKRLDQTLAHQIGYLQMTVLLYDNLHDEAERVFSSDPSNYPATGRKSFTQGPIMARVRDSGKPYVAFDRRALMRDFPDHPKIFAMGCESLVNLPLIVAGEVIGQINLLHEEGFYNQDKVEQAMNFVSIAGAELLGAPVFD